MFALTPLYRAAWVSDVSPHIMKSDWHLQIKEQPKQQFNWISAKEETPVGIFLSVMAVCQTGPGYPSILKRWKNWLCPSYFDARLCCDCSDGSDDFCSVFFSFCDSSFVSSSSSSSSFPLLCNQVHSIQTCRVCKKATFFKGWQISLPPSVCTIPLPYRIPNRSMSELIRTLQQSEKLSTRRP